MSIDKYHSKRDFKASTEPQKGKTSASKKLRFVVQRHHASRLHYDFRLELDGVLKSWAVPKGPSLNPKDKRLAMMVEDHPYSYKDFEGEIPKGNYGAGTVSIFDEGFYHSLADKRKDDVKTLEEGLTSGNLKFALKGKILKGEFALVRLKNAEENAWLLIKHDDEGAVHKKFDAEDLVDAKIKKAGKDFKNKKPYTEKKSSPKSKTKAQPVEAYSPMLATLSEHIFDSEDWIYERKLDGYRIIGSVGENVKLNTRNGKDYSDKYPSIVKELTKIKEECALDGELVALDKKGNDNFQLLQHYEESKVPLKFYVFDMLMLNGNDLTELPLLKRKKLLATLLKKYDFENIIYNDHVVGKGEKALAKANKEKWEGIIAKKKDAEYYVGKRSQSWLKFKFNNSQEAIICGFTKSSGSRKYFGALVLGVLDEHKKLKYIGNCGTGFTDKVLKSLYSKMEPLQIKKKPLSGKVAQESSVTWVKPELVCEVSYSEWTKDEHLRHPVFKGLREDKDKEAVKEELPKTDKSAKHKFTGKEDFAKSYGNKKVSLSNLDKNYWPKEKITKGDLLNYYDQVGKIMLPYLKDKPLSLNRHPNGISKPGFFQKDVDKKHIPKWAKTTVIHSESNNKDIDYLVCNDQATLLYMANLGCIEINPWLSSYKKPENPDFMVIDLDPDKNEFHEVVKLALVVKSVFDEMGIIAFVKTSGSSGMHIYVYIGGAYDYDFVKEFARFIAQKVHEATPDNTSIERSPSKRKGKIYIDFLQNRRGQTIAAPYSARPKPGATVSFPLNWDELDKNLDMKDYDIFNVPELINNRKDPWQSIFKKKQNLKQALKKMK